MPTPCHICPVPDNKLTGENTVLFQFWQMLSVSGREMGFGMGSIREEAIDALLTRYGYNTPDYYEKVLFIESEMLPYLQDKQEKRREQRRKEQQAQQKFKKGR